MGITIVGGVILLAGVVFLVLPGPGIPLIIVGLAILATEYTWARRALDMAKRRARMVADRVRQRRKNAQGTEQRNDEEPPAGAASG